MKKTGKLLGIILITAVLAAFAACKDDEPEPQPVYCPDTDNNGNGHLGVGEACIKTTGDCTGLQEYRTPEMKNASHADYFQWPIYRVGAVSHYGTNGADIAPTVTDILTGYNGLLSTEKTSLKNSSLEQVHVTYNAPDDWYTWGGKNLGFQKGLVPDGVKYVLIDLGNGTLEKVVALLQPASNIRMATNNAPREAVLFVIKLTSRGALTQSMRSKMREGFSLS